MFSYSLSVSCRPMGKMGLFEMYAKASSSWQYFEVAVFVLSRDMNSWKYNEECENNAKKNSDNTVKI